MHQNMKILCISLFLLQTLCTKAQTVEKAFQSPPNTAKPYTWWHWLDGNISKEGITKDLEAMKAVGIGGYQQFDGGLNMPNGWLR